MALSEPTASEVRVVISLADSVTDAVIEAYIADAVLILEACSGVASLSATRQAAIVKWTTAHLLSQRYGSTGQLVSKSLGDASESYSVPAVSGNFGDLKGSKYGQQAILLDTTGCLERLGKKRVIFERVPY